ncbi:MAG: histidinol-phosphate transaminase [Alphaproteobacteria bacterium]
MATLIPRPGIMGIAPYVGGKSALTGVSRVVKLSSNEGALGPSPKAIEAFRAASDRLHRYPDGHCIALREALGRRFGLDPARIVCGAGSDELLFLLGRAYVGPGENLVYTEHGFAMYSIIARSIGALPVAVPEKNLTADVDAILKAVTADTRAVFIANPNNPTGTYVPAAEIERLRAGLPANVLLVIDAAYAEFVTRNDYVPGESLVDRHDNVVMTRTFSKLFGLGGLRIGWAYCPVPVADVLNRIRGPFNVAAPAQAAGVAALADIAHQEAALAHNSRWQPWLEDQIRGLGLEVPPGFANFVLVRFPRDSRHDVDAAEKAMHARGLIPRRVADYGLKDHLRITVGLEEENKAVVAALRELMV